MRISIKIGERRKRNRNVISPLSLEESAFFLVLVIARYGSDVEDDSDDESEDDNAEVSPSMEINEYL